jgi:hypothetical protein
MPPKTPYDTNALIKQTQDMLKQTQEQGATAFAGSTYDTPASRVGAVQAITPSAMASNQPIVPVTTLTTPVTTPAPVEVVPNVQLTGEENQALTQQDSLQSLISDLTLSTSDRAQKSFQQQQKEALGMNAAQSSVNEFNDVAKNLAHEAEGIQLQLANLQQEQQAKGGFSTFQLNANQNAAVRASNQQLLSNSIKQYSNAASLYAAQGKLQNAITMVDNAVNAEFDPKFRALETAQANLSNLMKSGVLTTAEKKKAMNLQAEYDAQKEKIATDKANATTIQGMVLQAQQNNAPPALIGQARNAKDIYEVAQILSGWTAKETDASIQRYNKARQTGYTGSYADFLKDEEKNKLLGKYPPTQAVKAGVPSTIGKDGKYKSDLDAMVGNTFNIIASKFGQESFAQSIARARNDSDKLTAIATVGLTKAPADERRDFVSQAQGVKSIEKAIALIDSGVQSGLVEAGKQYTYNVLGQDYDPKLAQLNAYITSALQPYRASITGAAWGEQEDAEYAKLFASTKYTPEALKQRLSTLKQILTDKSATALQAYVSPLGVFGGEQNRFENEMNDPYGSYRAQLQPDEILVNRGGRMVAIPSDELLDTDEQL